MIIIGHRGARGLAPENTLASINKALEFKVDWVEFDVRVNNKGIPVLCHPKRIKNGLTTLEQALAAVNGRVPIYIEVKRKVNLNPIIKLLKNYRYDYLLASKSQKTLLQLHKNLPAVPKIVIEPWSGIRATARAKQLNTEFIAMNQSFLWSGFIASMKDRGYELYTYTLNNPKKAKRWAKHGLAGVITDFPDRFK
ncbi:glycerophosphodiester phosphodiesterase [Candidatus Saccharibacteria bacterium]|nr:glycerophosphodiester phosphodiesterase [Candidatus Saccharibacteria bacterium]